MDRSALIAYGTETGNALDLAEEIGRSLERLQFDSHVASLDDVDISSLSSFSILVLVVSTTGQGELPSNSRVFWKSLLRKKLPPNFLCGLKFTSFGIGDSSYPQFNWAVRKVHKRVTQLGALECFRRGEADEQHEEGHDGTFVPWLAAFREQVLIDYPLQPDQDLIPESELLPPKWLLESASDRSSKADGINGQSETQGRFIEAVLTDNRRLTPSNHWQDVRHLSFSSKAHAVYDPGDVLKIFPRNSEKDIKQIITIMHWDHIAEQKVALSPTRPHPAKEIGVKPPVQALANSTMTFRNLLTWHLDLNAIPRRSFFSLISHFTNDEFHKQRLQEFTKPEYIDELYDYTTRPRRSILEVLQEFDTVQIPWQWAANVLPALRERQFSIASGGDLKKETGHTRFDLLVAIVKYRTVIKKVREGVCTRYLANLPVETSLAVALQKGSLGLSKSNLPKPMVLIGPGTGVAPIRSILWQRKQWLDETPDTKVGEHLLIYGCRNEDSDFFYRKEWETLKQQIPLEVYAAFSRDQMKKVYVQDIIKQQGRRIHRLLHDLEGSIFVCGSSGKMPTAVRAALAAVFRDCDEISQTEAESYLKTMEIQGRYKQETWG